MMRKLLINGDYSDMRIICQDFQFEVHRNIICTQSSFFKAAMDSGFMESTTRTITLPDDDLDTIERVISFLYIHDYQEIGHTMPLKGETPHEPDVTHSLTVQQAFGEEIVDASAMHEAPIVPVPEDHIFAKAYNSLRVYIAADKFDIPDLKVLALNKFSFWLTEHWSSTAFPHIFEIVFTIVPRHDTEIRAMITHTIARNINILGANDKIRQLMRDFDILARRDGYSTLVAHPFI